MTRYAEYVRKLAGWLLVLAGLLGLTSQLRGVPRAPAGDVPQFQNARVEARKLEGSLADAIHHWAAASEKPRWLGYAVSAVGGEHAGCCSNYGHGREDECTVCALEGNGDNVQAHSTVGKTAPVQLEGAREIAVMFRAEAGAVGRIQEFSANCVADAGGHEVLWLDGVAASESIELLKEFVTGKHAKEEENESLARSALMALALHADETAERVLQSFVSPERPEWLRKQTAFWLGAARGAKGLATLEGMARSEPDTAVREQVTFAISVSREPEALTEVIRMAREDQSAQVRGQALFWLAQKAGKRTESAISGAIQNDPDTEVKKKALFALSQMPKDQGVPKLIEVARSNKNPEVRKQAMFWLGQSQDARALAFFEEILAR